MNTLSTNQFGLMMAYLLPGFIVLAGIAPFSPVVRLWLAPANQAQAGLGPPVYAVLAAATIGLILSCFRWLIVDHIHQWTGIAPPVWDDSRLEEQLNAFDYLVESHYRYYQFVGNGLIAVAAGYLLNRWLGTSASLNVGTDLLVLILCATLYAASRDALMKYYKRTSRLVGRITPEHLKGNNMFNGNDHQVDAGKSSSSKPELKPQKKPAEKPKPTPKPKSAD